MYICFLLVFHHLAFFSPPRLRFFFHIKAAYPHAMLGNMSHGANIQWLLRGLALRSRKGWMRRSLGVFYFELGGGAAAIDCGGSPTRQQQQPCLLFWQIRYVDVPAAALSRSVARKRDSVDCAMCLRSLGCGMPTLLGEDLEL